MRPVFYNVLDANGNVVLDTVRVKKAAEFLGVTSAVIRYRADTGWLINDKYEIEKTVPGDIEKGAKDVILTVCGQTVSFVKAWNSIRKQLGKC